MNTVKHMAVKWARRNSWAWALFCDRRKNAVLSGSYADAVEPHDPCGPGILTDSRWRRVTCPECRRIRKELVKLHREGAR